MVEGHSMTCIKYTLFVFNFVFLICGLLLVIFGAIVTKKDMTEFLDSKYLTAPVILIVVGCVIFVVAFFGCWGAVKENHFMVMIFGLLLFVIFILEIAGGITAYVYQGHVETFLKDNMNSSLSQQKEDFVKVWDKIQTDLQCCGVDSVKDYSNFKQTIPTSCCKDNKDPCKESDAYQKGCFPEVLHQTKRHVAIIAGVAVGFAVIELLGCILAWCLAAAIKREEKV